MVSLVERMLTLNKELPGKTGQERAVTERQIAATDVQIDRLVYALSGLTAEEVNVVEGQAGSGTMGREEANVTLVLTSDNEASLRLVAAQRGLSPEDALTTLLTEAQTEFEAAVAGIRRGMADAEAGREISLEAYCAQIEAAARQHSPQSLEEVAPRHQPPPGETAMQMIQGQWPGEETTEELLAQLETLG